MGSLIVLGAVAGLLAVDQRAGWQGLFAQPLFGAALVGLVLGNLTVCLCVGFLLELIYLSVVPMRGARIADHVAAGVVGAGAASLLAGMETGPGPGVTCAVGIALGLIAGEAGSWVTGPLFALHNRFLSSVEFAPDMERDRMARRLLTLHAASVAFIFAVEGVVVLALSAAGQYSAVRMARLAGPDFARGASLWRELLGAIGVASVIHLFWYHRFRNVAWGFALLAVIVLWLV
jgi:mannose/fructose/N-acetylgalactosamine-specific phosphotransferase system component IIC